jgi:hypothetical protein
MYRSQQIKQWGKFLSHIRTVVLMCDNYEANYFGWLWDGFDFFSGAFRFIQISMLQLG